MFLRPLLLVAEEEASTHYTFDLDVAVLAYMTARTGTAVPCLASPRIRFIPASSIFGRLLRR